MSPPSSSSLLPNKVYTSFTGFHKGSNTGTIQLVLTGKVPPSSPPFSSYPLISFLIDLKRSCRILHSIPGRLLHLVFFFRSFQCLPLLHGSLVTLLEPHCISPHPLPTSLRPLKMPGLIFGTLACRWITKLILVPRTSRGLSSSSISGKLV